MFSKREIQELFKHFYNTFIFAELKRKNASKKRKIIDKIFKKDLKGIVRKLVNFEVKLYLC